MSKPSFANSLSGRILLFGVLPTVLVIGAIVAWSAVETYKSLRTAEEEVLAADARGAAVDLNGRNDRWNLVAAILAQSQPGGMFGKRSESLEFIRHVNALNDRTLNTYFVYEPNADGADASSLKSDLPRGAMDSSGRFCPVWTTVNWEQTKGKGDTLSSATGMDTLEYYQGPKREFGKTGRADALMTEPRVVGSATVVSHVYPIVIDGKFQGIAGVDRDLRKLEELANGIKARSGADVMVLSSGGRVVASTVEARSGTESLEMKPIAETPFGSMAKGWMSVTAGGSVDMFDEVDPTLNEPCIYGVERTATGGWTIVVRRTKAEVMAPARAALLRNVAIGAIGTAIVAVLLLLVTGGVVRRVGRAASAADRIARGDLTQEIEEARSLDETGQLMRSMRTMDGSLNSLVGDVKQAGIRLNSTATEIAATSKQQEASSATFGAASNQIAAAVKEISATGQDLVKTVDSVSRMAAESASLATSGRAGLQSMEAVMRELDGATASIADKLNAINERSQKITTVITTITKVADQTNILSINAAIEAEKAGEYGSGFLVIAREIRRLADQTASATLDIEQMVRQMQGAVSAGVMEMDRFSDQVRRGVRDVVSAGSQMTEIIDRVNRSTDSFKQVNESMQAQSEGAQQISDAMNSLVGNANQTVQSAREFGRAATDLQSAIALLRDAVSKFRLRE
ncbi:MAG: methyl-accepting chemotaxis protein [Phycisphaeraceae bacterium]|nr:methyl-accepting chemotaxis protein [Phycisphaeraceae bacterium]